MEIKQLIIIGGGYSVLEGINKGLWNQLKGKFTFGTNYSYRFFDSTTLIFVDNPFYEEQKKRKDFKELPLVIGKYFKDLKYLPNTFPIKALDARYYRNITRGCYKSSLVGIFALSLGIYLLDEGEIFILGYDNKGVIKNKQLYTHWYQDMPTRDGEIIKHRGIRKTNYYDGIFKKRDRAMIDFKPFENETKVKIYNVSLNSRINYFPKISYDEFFRRLDRKHYNQDEIREYIKERLK